MHIHVVARSTTVRMRGKVLRYHARCCRLAQIIQDKTRRDENVRIDRENTGGSLLYFLCGPASLLHMLCYNMDRTTTAGLV